METFGLGIHLTWQATRYHTNPEFTSHIDPLLQAPQVQARPAFTWSCVEENSETWSYSTRSTMCGIYASVSRHGRLPPSSALESQLVQRGPDHIGSTQAYVPSSDSSSSNSEPGEESPGLSLTFVATVLSLRGNGITQQPVVSEVSGAILCWNGEAWSLGGDAIAGNDTAAIISTLDQASGQDAVLDVLRSIDGPFAFIYYDPPRDSRGGDACISGAIAWAAGRCWRRRMKGADSVEHRRPARLWLGRGRGGRHLCPGRGEFG
ncbi:unnamed protein product [Parascedosporium putredinis]|uniref:Uncharacterized protein n=1 Tax=Parascedosporium putredinis TaxID=1442378 RepID=A0A9P1M828_9PEZI|nr:unnamed protein product [Parascedosporium putredinis]CAI7992856.1 unnamed protein product [Parascedosporium putredinis]